MYDGAKSSSNHLLSLSSSRSSEAAIDMMSDPDRTHEDSERGLSSSTTNSAEETTQHPVSGSDNDNLESAQRDVRDQQSQAQTDEKQSNMNEEDSGEEGEEEWEDKEAITAMAEPDDRRLDSGPIPRKNKRTRQRSLDDDTDSENDDFLGPVDVSLKDLKRQIMGRDLSQEENEVEEHEEAELTEVKTLMNAFPSFSQNSTTAEAPTIAARDALCDKLKNDMTCAICHDIFYPPMSLLCGHTFCRPCLDWWLDQVPNCPTCRQAVSKEQTPRMPTLPLRACIMTLFGKEIVARLQSDRPRGEHGGAHGAGHQIVQPLDVGTWSCIEVSGNDDNTNSKVTPGSVQVRRNIVLDADDQRMQLALAMYRRPIKVNSRFHVKLCMLRMEEDEVEDSGFPVNLIAEEDEAFICSNENQFVSTFVEVKIRARDGHLSPLARVPCGTNGFFTCTLDPTQSTGNPIHSRAFLFEHSETGTQLEVDFAQLQSSASGGTLRPPRFDGCNSNVEREEAEDSGFVMGQNDHSDPEEHEDEFEEDGFVVFDGGNASDVHGEFSDDEEEDDDECCCVCHEGGEVMICDGGKENDGCKRLFHACCVGRDFVPAGDWVCQACAVSGGIDVGPQGHEFRKRKTRLLSDTTNAEASMLHQGNAFTDDDDQGDKFARKAGNAGRQLPPAGDIGDQAKENSVLMKKRRIVVDSDSD